MRKLLLLILFAGATQFSSAQTSSIVFDGNMGFVGNFATRSATITIDRIRNVRNGGTSGSLYVQAWLLPSAYNGVAVQNGHMLGEISLGTLRGGYLWSGLKYTMGWDTDPPAGTWQITLLLIEYNPLPGGNYWAMDWVNFDQLAVIQKAQTKSDHIASLNALLKKTEREYYQDKSGDVAQIISQKFSTAQFSDKFAMEILENGKFYSMEFTGIPWWALELDDLRKIENSRPGSNIIIMVLEFSEPFTYRIVVDRKDSEAETNTANAMGITINRADWDAVQDLLVKIAYSDE